jgi:hypothetical protein
MNGTYFHGPGGSGGACSHFYQPSPTVTAVDILLIENK